MANEKELAARILKNIDAEGTPFILASYEDGVIVPHDWHLNSSNRPSGVVTSAIYRCGEFFFGLNHVPRIAEERIEDALNSLSRKGLAPVFRRETVIDDAGKSSSEWEQADARWPAVLLDRCEQLLDGKPSEYFRDLETKLLNSVSQSVREKKPARRATGETKAARNEKIREAYVQGETQVVLAKRFNLSQNTISNIVNGKQ